MEPEEQWFELQEEGVEQRHFLGQYSISFLWKSTTSPKTMHNKLSTTVVFPTQHLPMVKPTWNQMTLKVMMERLPTSHYSSAAQTERAPLHATQQEEQLALPETQSWLKP